MGDAHIWIPDASGEWKCYEVPNVLLMPACSAVLYSVRIMRDLFGFKHDFNSDQGAITMPDHPCPSNRTWSTATTVLPIARSAAARDFNLIQIDIAKDEVRQQDIVKTDVAAIFFILFLDPFF